MKKGFYSIISAQFFSSLADNALLIIAIKILLMTGAPESLMPQIKSFFSLSYVVLAAFVGLIADAYLKGRVMFVTNLIKIAGAFLMFLQINPFISYAIVGLGAAAYSPAKYGILTELLPPKDLVKANGWIEGATIASIILGTVLGGVLISPDVLSVFKEWMLTFSFFKNEAGAPISGGEIYFSLLMVMLVYLIAAGLNLLIPDTGARYKVDLKNITGILKSFVHANKTLWRDPVGNISLSVTTLFWGAGAALQFIVLWWGEDHLHLTLSQGAILQGITGIGVAIGAVLAAKRIHLENAFTVLKYGFILGLTVCIMILLNLNWLPKIEANSFSYYGFYGICILFLLIVGGVSGYFVVPMNAMLQHRGHSLLSAGQSISVQNFNENLSILVLLVLLGILHEHLPTWQVILVFGSFIMIIMLLIIKRSQKISLISAAHHT
jgi:MFS transporter, LPLT family, lysophospholipid transporter